MKAGIIAAGLGERFRAAGIAIPKPLLEVGGRTLLERTIRAAADAGAEEVALIVNAESPAVERAAKERDWPVPVRVTVKTTPSSMESFFTLAPLLEDSPFLLFTVDAIFPAGSPLELARTGSTNGPIGTLAVTDHVDDEKPLWVRFGRGNRITALGMGAEDGGWVTSGLYFFFPEVYRHVSAARLRGFGALRQFLGFLLERELALYGLPIGESIDVDRPEDLRAAEEFLRRHGEA